MRFTTSIVAHWLRPKYLATILFATFVFWTSDARAQIIVGVNQAATINGLFGIKVFAGTQFPWTDRLGKKTYLSSGFDVWGWPNAGDFSVKLNGNLCVVTQDPTNPARGTWEYRGTPISVGNSAALFPLTVQFYGPDGLAVSEALGGFKRVELHVYKASYLATKADGTPSVDSVHPLTSLYWVPNKLNASDGLDEARELLIYFKVVGPPGVTPDFNMMNVGLIQIVSGGLSGSLAMRRVTQRWTTCYSALGP